MKISFDTLQIIMIILVLVLGVMALVNTKAPVDDKYYNDRYDKVQFDSSNKGCVWLLVLFFISSIGVIYGFYCFFQALGK